ncbi:MAG: FAD-dependent oxidoreductase [Culturomica sp.]|jgi:heterodisulfide reductase subunit A|nr:FAD-dependent oxidoreductase [Culturomica sp.]
MNIVIIGGGPAGSEAAYRLAGEGYTVDLVEKENSIGGNLNNWHQLFPDRKSAAGLVKELQQRLNHPGITLHIDAEAREIAESAPGKFAVKLSNKTVLHGSAVLLATGYKVFDAKRKEEYGYGIYKRVITSAELENLFTNRALATLYGEAPKRIGFIHCVGSRDEKICNYHCSKLCCVTAVKQAIEVREMLPEVEIFCFYMDMRMFGPGYEEMYREAQERYDIKFIRGRLSEAAENIHGQVVVKVEDTLVGKPLRMTLDLMVLMVGMEAADGSGKLAGSVQVPLYPNGFIRPADPHTGTNLTARPGIFTAGSCTSPMNLTDTLTDARSAAWQIKKWLTGSDKHA